MEADGGVDGLSNNKEVLHNVPLHAENLMEMTILILGYQDFPSLLVPIYTVACSRKDLTARQDGLD